MEKKELLYQGKAKKLYKTDDERFLWVSYLNQATALNGAKKATIEGKGQLNNQITSMLFEQLKEKGIQSHFVEQLSPTEQIIEAVTMFPLEVIVRNTAAGSFSKRLGVAEGTKLSFPVIEFYLKDDALDDPIINEDHVLVLDIADKEEIAEIKRQALEINLALLSIFKELGIRLVDFKLEFGIRETGEILLADEISPDTCRLWDLDTGDHLDKDVYRRDLGDLVPVYEEVLQRMKRAFV